jgi:undecaprenyl diphosphate synthase
LSKSFEHPKPPVAPEHMPRHVAIIMDGNGRWANKRLLPRDVGHLKGISALRQTVIAAREFGISYLTVYAFSTENWQRPQSEVSALMGLFRRFYHADIKRLRDKNVRVRFIGRRDDLDVDILGLIEQAEQMTEANTGLNLTIAFNYGAREELMRAARSLAADAATGRLNPATITEREFSHRLHTAGFPDVDLVIRAGREKRVSNFLLWQAAYAEYVFLDTLWPDFGREELAFALREYATRDRRFGRLPQDKSPEFEAAGGAIPRSQSTAS